MVVGELCIRADRADTMKMFDGQHRRRAIKDVMRQLESGKENPQKLATLRDASVPIMLYAEDSIDALQQMFADAAQTKTIEANAVTRFDQRDAFNVARPLAPRKQRPARGACRDGANLCSQNQ